MNTETVALALDTTPILASTLIELIEKQYVPSDQVNRMTIKRLRQFLSTLEIEVHNKHGVGYWLTGTDKEALRRVVSEGTA